MTGYKILTSLYEEVLKKSPFFKDLSGLELAAVVDFLETRMIQKGEVIFNEGDAGEEMFILVSGKIGAWINLADDTKRKIFEAKEGDFFGEMSIIANESRSATMIAQEDAEVLVLHGVDFFRLVFEYPMLGKKILRDIIKVQNTWLEQTSKHLADIARWGKAARRRAISDELTGLYNRRFLEQSANNHFVKGTVGLRNLSLMMMDLDKIHDINTCYGRKAGDLVFVSIAEVLRSTTRTGDICARLSGDEFAILLPDTAPEEALQIGEKVRETMASRKIMVPDSPESTGKTEIIVSTSIGIASAPVHTDCWEGLLLAADGALRISKESGRNRVKIAG
jgi:diguanylate cyclase (GGDEF)-like protein